MQKLTDAQRRSIHYIKDHEYAWQRFNHKAWHINGEFDQIRDTTIKQLVALGLVKITRDEKRKLYEATLAEGAEKDV